MSVITDCCCFAPALLQHSRNRQNWIDTLFFGDLFDDSHVTKQIVACRGTAATSVATTYTWSPNSARATATATITAATSASAAAAAAAATATVASTIRWTLLLLLLLLWLRSVLRGWLILWSWLRF